MVTLDRPVACELFKLLFLDITSPDMIARMLLHFPSSLAHSIFDPVFPTPLPLSNIELFQKPLGEMKSSYCSRHRKPQAISKEDFIAKRDLTITVCSPLVLEYLKIIPERGCHLHFVLDLALPDQIRILELRLLIIENLMSLWFAILISYAPPDKFILMQTNIAFPQAISSVFSSTVGVRRPWRWGWGSMLS